MYLMIQSYVSLVQGKVTLLSHLYHLQMELKQRCGDYTYLQCQRLVDGSLCVGKGGVSGGE